MTNYLLAAESKEVVVPPFADSVSEGDVRWEKNVGDQVAEDETVLEIETDKVRKNIFELDWCTCDFRPLSQFLPPAMV